MATVMTGPTGRAITTPQAVQPSTVTAAPASVSSIPIGVLVLGVGTALALADTQFAPVVVTFIAAACVYQLVKKNSGVVAKVLNSNPIPTKKG